MYSSKHISFVLHKLLAINVVIMFIILFLHVCMFTMRFKTAVSNEWVLIIKYDHNLVGF